MKLVDIDVSDILSTIEKMLLTGYCTDETRQAYDKTKGIISLKEFDDNENILYTVDCKVEEKPLVCKFDKHIINAQNEKIIANGNIFHFFNKMAKLSSLCDYLVFYPFFDKKRGKELLFCFVIDLKSTDTSGSPIQIIGQSIFAKFLLQQALKMLAYNISEKGKLADNALSKKKILNAHYSAFTEKFPFYCIRLLYTTKAQDDNNATKKDTSRGGNNYNFNQTLTFQTTKKESLDYFCTEFITQNLKY